jgi:hypothetical protein
MQVRRRNGAIFLSVAILAAAYLALGGRSGPEKPPPSTGTPQAAVVADPPSATAFPTAAPTAITSAAMPSIPTPPKIVPHPDEKRCGPGGQWAELSGSHGPGGSGCLARGADGGLVRDGFWSLVEADGRTKSGEYVGGVEEGRWTWLYPQGGRSMEMTYVHGVPHGVQTEWTPEGHKLVERPYRDGFLDGTVVITYPDGTVLREEWRHGVRVDAQ